MIYAVTISPKDIVDLDISKLYSYFDRTSTRFVSVRQLGDEGNHPHYHLLVDSAHQHDYFRKLLLKVNFLKNPTRINLKIEKLRSNFGGYLFHENPKAIARYNGSWDFKTYRELGKKMHIIFEGQKLVKKYAYVSHTTLPFILQQHVQLVSQINQIVSPNDRISWDTSSFIKILLELGINPTNNVKYINEVMDTTHVLIQLSSNE